MWYCIARHEEMVFWLAPPFTERSEVRVRYTIESPEMAGIMVSLQIMALARHLISHRLEEMHCGDPLLRALCRGEAGERFSPRLEKSVSCPDFESYGTAAFRQYSSGENSVHFSSYSESGDPFAGVNPCKSVSVNSHQLLPSKQLLF